MVPCTRAHFAGNELHCGDRHVGGRMHPRRTPRHEEGKCGHVFGPIPFIPWHVMLPTKSQQVRIIEHEPGVPPFFHRPAGSHLRSARHANKGRSCLRHRLKGHWLYTVVLASKSSPLKGDVPGLLSWGSGSDAEVYPFQSYETHYRLIGIGAPVLCQDKRTKFRNKSKGKC